MTRYVAGFYVSTDRNHVALVEKRKPSWQAGRLNAIGGKIEFEELPKNAMRREFKEEAGIDVAEWKPTIVLVGKHYEVHFFTYRRWMMSDVDRPPVMHSRIAVGMYPTIIDKPHAVDRLELDSGVVIMQYPKEMTPEDFSTLQDWINLQVSRWSRKYCKITH